MFEYLTGIYNITPTPFTADGALDESSLRKLTEFTRGTRVNGMTILGVLGEADKLTESERDRVTEIVIDAAGPEFPICVGTTHAGTDGCIAYSRRAQELSRLAVAPTLRHAPPLPGHTLTAPSTKARLVRSGRRSERSPLAGAINRATTLYSVGPRTRP